METFFVLLVLFVAVGVHAGLGFGTALIAMPFLTVMLGLPVAAPVVAIVMTLTILATLAGEWRHIDLRAAATLIGFSILGMPLGALLVREVDPTIGQAGLGLILFCFSVFRLANVPLSVSEHIGWRALAGVSGGCFGAAYNTNAPPVVIYGSLANWPPDQFRGTLQGFFLPSSVLICATHAGFGLWTWEVVVLVAMAIPVVLLAIWFGRIAARHLSRGSFERAVYVLSGVMGAGLMGRAVF